MLNLSHVSRYKTEVRDEWQKNNLDVQNRQLIVQDINRHFPLQALAFYKHASSCYDKLWGR